MVELMCDRALNYFVRVWYVGHCADIPVRNADAGLRLVAFINRGELQRYRNGK